MRIRLNVYILMADPSQTDKIDSFLRERHRTLQGVADHFRRFEPFFHDQYLVFEGLSPVERRMIENYCQGLGMEFSFAPHPQYTPEEIAEARFLRLGIAHDEIDCDRDGRHFNDYPRRLCTACGSPDLRVVPSPYVIKRPKRKNAIFNASNGLRIVSRTLWQQLGDVLSPWVTTGDVSSAEVPEQPLEDLLCIMPTHLIGPYSRTVVLDRCGVCQRPTQARLKDPGDVILYGMDVVTEIPTSDAPIALVGMWFGSLRRGKPPSVSWDIVISGDLHSRLCKMKVKGFVPADRPIHTEVEANKMLSEDVPAES